MREIREILADLEVPVLSMKELGLQPEIREDGKTFEENALIKARAVAALVPAEEDAVVLADDSGLEIDALGGEPGVFSARYMGETTSYHIKNMTLVRRLEMVPPENRTARFVCAAAAVLPDGSSFTERGVIEGWIGYTERGHNGFGYDPIFCLPGKEITTAELSPEEKNRISHRGNALRAVRRRLAEAGL